MLIYRFPFIIHHYASIGSTNDHLKAMVDAPEFTCVVADEQSAGRGRHSRTWHSTPGDGLYLSVLLCPHESSSKIPLLSLMAGIAVAEVLIERDVAGVDIKWPNDVLVNERKICGILAEGTSSGSNIQRIILGIGVNLNHKSFQEELSRIATSLAIETGHQVVVDEFRDQLLERIAHWYERWNRGEEQEIIKRFEDLSSYARGKKIIVALEAEQIMGETKGLTETGALCLITSEGKLRDMLAGEVLRLRGRGDAADENS
ncbi:MAG: biotin--[acetyl-CoA-carboxylase] ligase [Acidobacteria bacterium]|nr:biotin--[acetyl-CoA-carboxylase] ligase [Acidobacteriota bacterium]